MIGDKEGFVIKLGGYKFVQTCCISPEQYDIFNENDAIIGYMRLRWGNLRVFCPNYRGKQIFLHAFGEEWKGEFESENERNFYLDKIIDALDHYFDGATERDF